MTDVVYLVRPGDDNEELRYSLRSLVNLPHGRVWIAGHKPPWVTGVGHIATDQRGRKWANARRNLTAAIEHPDMPATFVLFNDDFYVIESTEEVPVLHRGTVADSIAVMRRDVGLSGYVRGLAATNRLLGRRGFAAPLCYSLHVPLPVDKAGMREALRITSNAERYHLRTIYGNLAGIGGTLADDCKARSGRPVPVGPFLSSSDSTFHMVSDELARRFPDPSPYELA